MSWFGGKQTEYAELATPTTVEQYQQIANKSIHRIDKLCAANDWQPLDFPDDSVKLWDKTVAGSTQNILKLQANVPYSALKLTSLLRSTKVELAKKWAPELLEKKHLAKIEQGLDLIYIAYAAPWPVTSREFLFLQKLEKRDETIIHGTFSINSDKYAGNPAWVRATLFSCWYITPIGENECQVIRVVELDPKGSIPAMIVQRKKLDIAHQLVTLRQLAI